MQARSQPRARLQRVQAGSPKPTHTRRSALLSGAKAGLGGTALIAGGALIATAAAGAAAANAAGVLPGGGGRPDARALVRSGMQKFRENRVEEAAADFDAALAAAPAMRPYLWQRGLALYYLQDYAEGARQFRDDVAVNPNDTEEAIWAFLCEAALDGADAARAKFLKVGRDPRPVMRAALEAFERGNGDGGAAADAILAAAAGDAQAGGHDAFYARLYAALWHEAHIDSGAAKREMLSALATRYAQSSGDYMASLAKVHALRRGWA